MSFSSEIKEKIIKERSYKASEAYILGILGFGGELRPDCVRFFSENETVADEINCVMGENIGSGEKEETGKGYKISFCKNTDFILDYMRYAADNAAEAVERRYMPGDTEKREFIKGAFIAGGSASNPEKSYHIEFDTKYREFADVLCASLESFGINAKITGRKGRCIVYLKEYEAIADVINIMGAGSAAFKLYNVQIEKEMRNDINRRVNFETANAEKTVKASTKQLYAIKKIIAGGKFETLPENLKEVARLRMENTDASLKTLGEMLSPPIGKSGVNHRLEKLIDIAEDL